MAKKSKASEYARAIQALHKQTAPKQTKTQTTTTSKQQPRLTSEDFGTVEEYVAYLRGALPQNDNGNAVSEQLKAEQERLRKKAGFASTAYDTLRGLGTTIGQAGANLAGGLMGGIHGIVQGAGEAIDARRSGEDYDLGDFTDTVRRYSQNSAQFAGRLNRDITQRMRDPVEDLLYTPEQQQIHTQRKAVKSARQTELSRELQQRAQAEADVARGRADFAAMSAKGAALTKKTENPAMYALYNPDAQFDSASTFMSGGSLSDPLIDYQYMTQDELDVYNYFIATEGVARAEKYKDSISYAINERKAKAQSAIAQGFAEENPVAGSAASVATNLAQAGSYLNTAGTGIHNMFSDVDLPVDPNSDWGAAARLTSDLREGAMKNITGDGRVGKYLQKQGMSKEQVQATGEFLYSSGMSMADCATAMLIFGPMGEKAVLGAMSSTAAGATAQEAAEAGMSAGEGLALATLAGAGEAITEKLPLDNLFNLVENPTKMLSRQAIKNTLKQVGIEASEELLTSYMNTLSDIAIAGDKSQYAQLVAQYKQQGMTQAAAEAQAQYQLFFLQPMQDAAAGALSGGVFGVGGTVMGDIRTRQYGRQLNAADLTAQAQATGDAALAAQAAQMGNSAFDRGAMGIALDEYAAKQQTAADLQAKQDSGLPMSKAETAALSVLNGETPSQSDMVALRDGRTAERKAFEELTGIEIRGVDASTLMAKVKTEAGRNAESAANRAKLAEAAQNGAELEDSLGRSPTAGEMETYTAARSAQADNRTRWNEVKQQVEAGRMSGTALIDFAEEVQKSGDLELLEDIADTLERTDDPFATVFRTMADDAGDSLMARDSGADGKSATKPAQVSSTTNPADSADIRFSARKVDSELRPPYNVSTVEKAYLKAVDPIILEQAQQHRERTVEGFKRQKVTGVPLRIAKTIMQETGIDLSGKDVYISSSTYNHIEKRHGINGTADSSMSDLRDLARIGYVIQEADDIIRLTENGHPLFSKEYRLSDNTPAPLFLIKKKIDGTYYCTVAAIDGKWERIWITTAYINKAEGFPRELHAELSALSETSETRLTSNPSTTDSVPSDGDSVKPRFSTPESTTPVRFSTPKRNIRGATTRSTRKSSNHAQTRAPLMDRLKGWIDDIDDYVSDSFIKSAMSDDERLIEWLNRAVGEDAAITDTLSDAQLKELVDYFHTSRGSATASKKASPALIDALKEWLDNIDDYLTRPLVKDTLYDKASLLWTLTNRGDIAELRNIGRSEIKRNGGKLPLTDAQLDELFSYLRESQKNKNASRTITDAEKAWEAFIKKKTSQSDGGYYGLSAEEMRELIDVHKKAVASNDGDVLEEIYYYLQDINYYTANKYMARGNYATIMEEYGEAYEDSDPPAPARFSARRGSDVDNNGNTGYTDGEGGENHGRRENLGTDIERDQKRIRDLWTQSLERNSGESVASNRRRFCREAERRGFTVVGEIDLVALCYKEAQPPFSETTNKLLKLFSKIDGIRLVVTDGAAYTNHEGKTIERGEMVAGPDGLLLIRSDISEVSAQNGYGHEVYHIARQRGLATEYSRLMSEIDQDSSKYSDILEILQLSNAKTKSQIDDEFCAYVSGWIQEDVSIARERLGSAVTDEQFEAIVQAQHEMISAVEKSKAPRFSAPKPPKAPRKAAPSASNYSPNLTRTTHTITDGSRSGAVTEIDDAIGYIRTLPEEQREAAQNAYNSAVRVANALGHRVHLTDGEVTWTEGSGKNKTQTISNFDGFIFGKNGDIFIDADILTEDNATIRTIAHELGHQIVSDDPTLLVDAYNLTMEYYKSIGQEEVFEEKLNGIMARYAKEGLPLSDSDYGVYEELFADTLADLEEQSGLLEYAAGKKPKLIQRIISAIRKFTAKLRGKNARAEIEYLDNMRTICAKALEQHRMAAAQNRSYNFRNNLNVQSGTSVTRRDTRTAAKARAHGAELDASGAYATRGARKASPAISEWGAELDTDALSKTAATLAKRVPHEVNRYGYRKVIVNGQQRTVFVTNPDMHSTDKGFAKKYGASVNAARAIAGSLGIRIGFVTGSAITSDARTGRETQQTFDCLRADDGTVYVNLDAKQPYASMMSAAVWSKLKSENPKTANEILRTIGRISRLRPNAAAVSPEALTAQQFTQNAEIESGLILSTKTTNGAKAVVANHAELVKALSNNPSLARAVNQQKPGIIRRLAEFIGDRVTPESWRNARAAGLLQDAQARLLSAISEMADRTQTAGDYGEKVPSNAGAVPATSSGASFMSINPSFATEVDEWDGKSVGGYFNVGSTSDVLQLIGMPAQELRLDKSKAVAILDKHKDMSRELIKQIPLLLEDPVVIIESEGHPNRVIAFGELYDKAGLPVMAVVEMNLKGDSSTITNISKVISAYGRKSIKGFINEGNTLYLNPNKKRTTEWFQSLRLQLPVEGTRPDGYIRSIAYFGRNSNGNFSSQSDSYSLAETPMQKALREANERKSRAHFSARNSDTSLRSTPKTYTAQQARQMVREGQASVRDTYRRRDARSRIKADVKALDKALRNPDDVHHVPDVLKYAITDFLQQFTNDTSVFTKQQLILVKDAYNRISESGAHGEEDISFTYDADIAEAIGELAETIDGRRLAQLTLDETEDVRKIVQHFRHLVSNGNRLIAQERRETVSKLGESILTEVSGRNSRFRSTDKSGLFAAFKNMLVSGNITPAYFFKHLGGTMQSLFKSMREGQNVWATNMTTARDFYKRTARKYHANRWLDKRNDTLTFETARGETVELTRQQALTIYATAKRERINQQQQAGHLSMGGFVYEKDAKIKGKSVDTTKAHPLNDTDVSRISAWLTQEQRQFADELVEYMSTTLSALGNETSVKLHGYEKFLETYYFPYNSADNYLYSRPGVTSDARLKSMGFTKATMRRANNPIILSDFTSVWGSHTQRMLMYHALAPRIEDFTRVYNYRTSVTEDSTSRSVKEALERTFGAKANTYIKQFLNDVNGGIQSSGVDFYDRMISLFKKSAVFASASVVFQQPSAIARAMAVVDPKYFAQTTFAKRDYEECKKYCGTAIIKEMGRFDTGTGRGAAEWLVAQDYTGARERISGFVTDASYRDDVMSLAASKADELTWAHIWNAVKRETAATTRLQQGTEEFFKAAAARFDDVINYTQVYDSVFSRSELMRNTDTAAKMLTSFMSEPTVSYNMLFDAFQHAKDKGMAGRVPVGRAIAAFACTELLNTLLKSLVTAARDDDDKKTYLEKYLGEVVENFIAGTNPLNLVPYVRDIVSIYKGYDVDNSAYNLVSDLVKAAKGISNDKKSGWDKVWALADSLSAFFGIPVKNIRRDLSATYRIMESAISPDKTKQTTKTGIVDSILDKLPVYDNTVERNYERLYDAIRSGNTQREARLRDMLAANGEDEDDINAGLKRAIKDKYQTEDMSADDALDMLTATSDMTDDEAYWAVQEWQHKMTRPDSRFSQYTRLEEAIASGKKADIVAAITELTDHGKTAKQVTTQAKGFIKEQYISGNISSASAGNLLTSYCGYEDRNDVYWQIDEWEHMRDNPTETYSKFGDLYDAIDDGNSSSIQAAIRELLAHGVKLSTIKGQITRRYGSSEIINGYVG